MLEQHLQGGFARQRRMFVNNVHVVNASVLLKTKTHAQYFWAFWRLHTQDPKPFLWRLITDSAEAQDHTCQFVAESLSVGERSGVAYNVSFQVRCKPLNNGDLAFDQQIIDLWESGSPLEMLNLLEKLVNESFPDALGV
ncbi:hypothetical protein [Acinetobacter sp. YH18001]|nr:hypothetical protein [Acinetobacter sp. YH18001]